MEDTGYSGEKPEHAHKEEDFAEHEGAGDNESLLLTFKIGDAYYALHTEMVQEVILVKPCTVVRGAPEYVLGILNLRGKIVTVMDLASRIGLGHVKKSDSNRILVFAWKEEQIGLMVDRVIDVISRSSSDICPPPTNIDEKTGLFYEGVYQEKDRLVTLLKLEKILIAGEN